MSKKRLAIITHEFYPILCGGTIFTDKIASEFVKRGYEVDILTTGIGKSFQHRETRDGYHVCRFFTGRRSVSDAHIYEHLFFLILGLPQMLFYLLRHRPTVLFPVFAFPSGLISIVISKLLRVPTYVFVDAADVPGVDSAMKSLVRYLAFLLRFVTRFADGVVICEGIEDLAAPFVRNPNWTVIPNGTDLKEGHARIPAGEVVQFLSIGRLVLRKGFHDIIEALALLQQTTSRFHLTIIGYGRQQELIEELLAKHGLEKHVTLAGRVEYSKLKDYYLNSDCYLFYGNREGSSLAMIEAVAYGLPVLASDHPGNRTYVHDSKNGYLVNYGDHADLAAKMATIINHRTELRDFGEASKLIAERYSWARIAEQYDQFFARPLPPIAEPTPSRTSKP